MAQSGHWTESGKLNLDTLRRLLSERFAEVDFNQAKNDVRPFTRDEPELQLWGQDFFQSLVNRVEGV